MTNGRGNTDELCINTLRTLAMDAVQRAGSGHPGTAMGAAAAVYTLWSRHLRHNPANPDWPDRDRFVLSPGHASILLYSLLSLTGYDLPIDELGRLRRFGSKTPGHPERGLTPGVELTTGPLGAGFAMAVGLAMAERFRAEHFNRPGFTIVDHRTFGLCSDGDLMEGVASEAASLAGTLGLGKLIFLYDDNGISIEGSTDLAFREDVVERFRAYGWHVQSVDGEDVEAVDHALLAAREAEDQPSLIVARTTIAYGSPGKSGTAAAHGAPLGADEVRLTKRALGWPEESSFSVPDEARREFQRAMPRGRDLEDEWTAQFERYASAHPAEAARWDRVVAGALPSGWDNVLPRFEVEDGPMATRAASGKVLNQLITVLDEVVGGSADLAPSTNTYLKGYGDLGFDEWCGHNIHFGVREHAMGSITNGMAAHGGLIPYCATFFVFSDYMRPSIRLAALMGVKTIFIFTHDSIGVGEDGPTHQPIEHLASLRAMPGLTVLRPADANETTAAWKVAVERSGPTALVLSRQGLAVLPDTGRIHEGVPRGAYVLVETGIGLPDVILMATGSEVGIALEASRALATDGVAVRVVSMPSWDLFEAQSAEYREAVLPVAVRARVAVEAAASLGWHRYTGDLGEVVGLDHFGASGAAGVLFQEFGITPEALATAARLSLARVGSDSQRPAHAADSR